MTTEDKKTLAKLLQQRVTECQEENLEKRETCRLDCPSHENCEKLQVLFELIEELYNTGEYFEEEE